jgi:adenine-specific DNA-methyltransferase
MRKNRIDGGKRKFVAVQIEEEIEGDFENLCRMGQERLQRAGVQIAAEQNESDAQLVMDVVDEPSSSYDIGFRVLRIDSSNFRDTLLEPGELNQSSILDYIDNLVEGRTAEDLLFQVMLDLGVLLSSKIEETNIDGKKVFSVADGYLIACFDKDVTDETVKAIAKKQPFYAVFRDAGIASDSVMTNFEQIFETYSPRTQRKVL